MLFQILELGCARESEKLYEAGVLKAVMNLIINFGDSLFHDTVRACMTVITRLVSRIEPTNSQFDSCIHSLSILSQHPDSHVRS